MILHCRNSSKNLIEKQYNTVLSENFQILTGKQYNTALSEQFQNSIGKITVRDKIDTINTRIQVHDSSFYCLSTDTSENLFRKLIFSHSY